jgi:hypothetical protein
MSGSTHDEISAAMDEIDHLILTETVLMMRVV